MEEEGEKEDKGESEKEEVKEPEEEGVPEEEEEESDDDREPVVRVVRAARQGVKKRSGRRAGMEKR